MAVNVTELCDGCEWFTHMCLLCLCKDYHWLFCETEQASLPNITSHYKLPGWNSSVGSVGLALLLHAVSWVQCSCEEKFSGRGDFCLGVNMGSDSIPPKLWMRV